MTHEQAKEIIIAHEIDLILDEEDTIKELQTENPELLDAYRAIVKFANTRS